MESKPLVHNNEFHLIKKSDIHKAVEVLVENLNLAAGSTDGFDLYKVIETYFTDLNKRHKINHLLHIEESCNYYGEKEQEHELKETIG
ncbi:hypothetical protein [Parabacteroides bouchesdurhonensis]|uniref:hypothetical protein n=1 Tax=Parabacteroides bouchesdurhonensis TaxID=1936995 RepID=UPI000C862D3F|nr:hypothetical protein [Parabacteroides bouchesdurhonensis]RHJ90157.1 hypothetical protein DW095_14075 [Bacteroides sp. AM07-16]